jgi:DNA modification methylase
MTDPDARQDVGTLVPDPTNRRTHPARNLEMVEASLRRVGAARSIVIDEDDVILAGNGVTDAAKAAGITHVRVIEATGDELIAVRRRGLTPDQKRELAMYDNRSAELAEWNFDQLRADADAGLDLKAFWSAEELAALLATGLREGQTSPDEVPPVRETSIQSGDVFDLGPHRLICGDSSDAAQVSRLLRTDAADALFTSPPYNVGVNYATHDDATQTLDVYFAHLSRLAHVWATTLRKGRAFIWNVGVSPKTAPHRHVAMLEGVGLTFVRQFIWQKTGVPVPTFYATRADPSVRRLTSNYTHEMVYVLTTGADLEIGAPQALRNEVLEHDVFSVHQSQATVDIPAGAQRTGVQSNLDRRSHPAAFPVALVIAFLQHYTAPGEIVVEPFAGSGSTLIACEQLGARCFAMELAAEYVQVAIDRWEAFTGQKAQKLAGL